MGVIVSSVPVSIMSMSVPPPLLALMPVYFWALVRPDLMPPWVVFAIGLFEDLLSGSPAGLWAISFVASYAFVDRQRDSFAGLSGIGAILGFALAALIASIAAYIVAWIYFGRIPPVTSLVLQIVTTVLFYIPGATVLNWIQRRLVGPLRSDF